MMRANESDHKFEDDRLEISRSSQDWFSRTPKYSQVWLIPRWVNIPQSLLVESLFSPLILTNPCVRFLQDFPEARPPIPPDQWQMMDPWILGSSQSVGKHVKTNKLYKHPTRSNPPVWLILICNKGDVSMGHSIDNSSCVGNLPTFFLLTKAVPLPGWLHWSQPRQDLGHGSEWSLLPLHLCWHTTGRLGPSLQVVLAPSPLHGFGDNPEICG